MRKRLKRGHRGRRPDARCPTTRPFCCRCASRPITAASRTSHLQWLSRRWIYNIPRSLQTQGFRPLGRLALVDHFDRVTERIERAIQAAVDAEGVAASARNTGLPFREAPPRVFIVSSISGGTGSGMVLDVGYLVRKILRDLGPLGRRLCGVLAHCSGRNSQGRDLAVANAYACLSELHHYSNSQYAYPGDPACGLPAFAAQDAPFQPCLRGALGRRPGTRRLRGGGGQAGQVSVLQCGHSGRARSSTSAGAPTGGGRPSGRRRPAVRTFGLCQLGFSHDDVPAAAADELCEALVDPLARQSIAQHGGPACLARRSRLAVGHPVCRQASPKTSLRAEVAARAAAVGLDVERIVEQLYATATREMGADPESYLLTRAGELMSNHESGRAAARPPARRPR